MPTAAPDLQVPEIEGREEAWLPSSILTFIAVHSLSFTSIICSRYFPGLHIAYFNLIPLLAPEQAAYHTGSSSRPRLDGNNIIINKQLKS